jgi:hypothetical protein
MEMYFFIFVFWMDEAYNFRRIWEPTSWGEGYNHRGTFTRAFERAQLR